MSEQVSEHEHRVTPLELFFDLVFVFAFTQVTTLMSEDTTWSGLGHGMLILAALWWAWTGYAWLTNWVDPDEGVVRGAMLVAIVALFIAALAVPDAFGHEGVLFGVFFLLVRLMHLALFALSARGDRDLLAAVRRLAPSTAVGAGLIIAAGFVDGGAKPVLWLAALSIDYVGPLVSGVTGWRVEPTHFAERHALVLIIALGEAFIAMGVGASETGITVGVVLTTVLGLVVATSMWLAYFDFFSIRAPQMLAARTGADRNAVARDIFSYLHLPLVAGIVLVALAMKKTLAHVEDPLETIPALGLFGGTALYLLTYSAIRFRVARSLSRGRTIAALASVALLPVGIVVPALVALALATAVWVALHIYEFVWWREARAVTRAQRVPVARS